jgi:hypothetical protein
MIYLIFFIVTLLLYYLEVMYAPENVGTRRAAFFPHFALKAAKPSDWN